MEYIDFLKSKTVASESFGYDTTHFEYNKLLFPHQQDLVDFCLSGGRRAIFASFGLGKTLIQLEIARQVILQENRPFLIVCPLGVSGEFKRDNRTFNVGLDIEYITDTDSVKEFKNQIYLTNYERIRKGDIDAEKFAGVSFDEASILRNLQTETTNYVLQYFKKVKFRYIATATPTPNDYIEILNYADYLGVISRGHALTRFFQRDSQKAGNLKLYENKKDEFWQWVSTWAAFLNSPADLGYDDKGYDLPKLNIIEHIIDYEKEISLDEYGNPMLFKKSAKDLIDCSREKRESSINRIKKAIEITKQNPTTNYILWHSLEYERDLLEKKMKSENYVSVFGSQKNAVKEQNLIDFSEGKYQYLLTKSKIAGSGCNFQKHCSDMIFVGIDYKFNDFIQSIHRCYRFGQNNIVNVHIIFTDQEQHIMKTLYAKWKKHDELNRNMIQLVKEYGLNSNLLKSEMRRKMFTEKKCIELPEVTMYNDDCVTALDNVKDNSQGLILTSIPFGDHYEYSDNYNDFGHNHGNAKFFEQMDYLVPKLLRVLMPGRIAAIHVKDRIKYSYQNGTSFTTISDFSGQTVANFEKHGFFLIGKITVTTDVVAENNQTYRLGWTEQCKDGSKMGVGLPEYVLLFRKPPSSTDNAYADLPVFKEKENYTKARWQLDAHAYYRSSGDRFLTIEELKKLEPRHIFGTWKKHNLQDIYDYKEHLFTCEELDKLHKLSSTFMTLPVHSNNDMVWTDINRMNTLNTAQALAKKEKHICPLQLDIIERLIERYSMQGETVLDPFGGLFSTAYQAIKMNRKSTIIELNPDYFANGLFYVKALLHKLKVPTLFDYINVA